MRNQKRSQLLRTPSALPMMARQRAWSRRGGESSRLTSAGETHWRRFEPGPLSTPDMISVHPPLSPPPFCSFYCALMFFKNRCQTWAGHAHSEMEHKSLQTVGGGGLLESDTARQQTRVCSLKFLNHVDDFVFPNPLLKVCF